jgi:rare lipoprotein A
MRGLASWYGERFNGRKTASGERYNMHAMTAAHRTLPFGTRIEVKAVKTGKKVVLRVNDRGPYKGPRILDVSKAAALELGMLKDGITEVEIRTLNP